MCFLPDDDSSEFQVSVQAPEGTSLEETQVRIARIARDIRHLDGVKYTIASVADTDQRNPYQGDDLRAAGQHRRARVRPIGHHGFRAEQDTAACMWPTICGSASRRSRSCRAAAQRGERAVHDRRPRHGRARTSTPGRVMADLHKRPARRNVDSSLSIGKPQYGDPPRSRPRRPSSASRSPTIANTLRLLVAGDKVSDYTDQGEQYEVHVRSIADARNRLDELKMVTVPSSKFGTVPLGDVVRFVPGTGPAEINRLARTRQVTVSANLDPATSKQAVHDAIAEHRQN